jgi:serine phosphatase RsbU (regulator of sigma subunit)
VVWLEDGRLPVLGQATRTVQPGLVATPPGSTLILYTDGLVESPDHGIDDGIRSVATVAGRASDLPNPGHILASIVELLSTGARRDDAAIIVATVDR